MALVLLTHDDDARAKYYGEDALARLRALGEVRLNHGSAALDDPGRLIERAQGCRVIVSDRQAAAPAEVFEQLPDLVAFVRCAVDIRNVDVAAASAAGVLVTRASPGFIDSVAELTLGFMLAHARGIVDAALAYRAGEVPEARMGTQLAGATLGIIGYGSIGRRLAELGLALRMRVLISDPYAEEVHPALVRTELGALLSEADFVVVLAVATEETENLIGAGELARMKPSACLINVSRGNLIDEAALEQVLEEGKIASVAMDVGRAPDQMPSPRLAARANVIATPHIGGLVPQAIAHQALGTTLQVAAILEGRAPEGAVNAEHAQRLGAWRGDKAGGAR